MNFVKLKMGQCWSCAKQIVNSLLCCLSKLILETFFATIIGIFVLAGTLAILSQGRPELYRWLTKWANQPALPIVKQCVFTPQSNALYEEPSAVASLKSYSVTFGLDTSMGNSAYAIAFTDDLRYGLYPKGFNGMPMNSDEGYLVLPKGYYENNALTITAIYDASNEDLKQLKYESYDCPIELYFFGGG